MNITFSQIISHLFIFFSVTDCKAIKNSTLKHGKQGTKPIKDTALGNMPTEKNTLKKNPRKNNPGVTRRVFLEGKFFSCEKESNHKFIFFLLQI